MCDKEQQFISDTLSWDSLENRPNSNNHTTPKNAKNSHKIASDGSRCRDDFVFLNWIKEITLRDDYTLARHFTSPSRQTLTGWFTKPAYTEVFIDSCQVQHEWENMNCESPSKRTKNSATEEALNAFQRRRGKGGMNTVHCLQLVGEATFCWETKGVLPGFVNRWHSLPWAGHLSSYPWLQPFNHIPFSAVSSIYMQ